MRARSDVRVAHVSTAHKATDNRIFHKECMALSRAGFDVTLIARADDDDEVDGVQVRALPRREGRIARMVRGPLDAWRQLRKVDPRVVHVHDPELIPLAALWKLRTSAKVIFDAHEDLPAQILSKSYLPSWSRRPLAAMAEGLERVVDRTLDAAVVAIPEFVEKFGRTRTAVVQNYPWLSQYPEPTEPPSDDRLVYVGGLTRIRGVEQMVEAVGRSRFASELTIAGPVQEEAIREPVEAADRVSYLGVLPPEEIPHRISEGAIGMLLYHHVPNHERSKPTKLFEYMAGGRPFIASDIGYWRELVGGEGGVFVDPLDVDAVAAAIDDLVGDPVKARAMGRRGRRELASRFTFESEAATLVDLYDRLLATSPARPATGATSGAVRNDL